MKCIDLIEYKYKSDRLLVLNKIDNQKVHLCHCMLHELNRGSTTAEATRNICAAYDAQPSTIPRSTVGLQSSNLEPNMLTDKPRSGTLMGIDD